MIELIPPPNQKTTDLPRWACPLCHGTDVQVLMQSWYRETRGYNLTAVGDPEGDILRWSCEDCDENAEGKPVDLMEARPGPR